MDASEGSLEGGRAPLVLVLYNDPVEAWPLAESLAAARLEAITCPVSARPSTWSRDLTVDLVLLLPPDDHHELIAVCEAIRRETDLPVVVLSSRTEESIIARALELGIDEYLYRPVGGQELAARITTVIRRTRAAASGKSRPIVAGDLVLFPDDLSVRLDGRAVRLSPTEFRLLACLASWPGKVFTHQALMARVWGAEYVDSRHYLHVYIGYLRDKLEDDPINPRLIVNAWGVGYKLEAPTP